MKALKKQVDAFQITKSFVPNFDESLRHLELIQAQIDLDKKIQGMSHLTTRLSKFANANQMKWTKKARQNWTNP
jgi:hypothetical protein